jgi:hypothetical protein
MFPLRTATDVLALLGEQVAAVGTDTAVGAIEKASTRGYLATVSLKAFGAGIWRSGSRCWTRS